MRGGQSVKWQQRWRHTHHGFLGLPLHKPAYPSSLTPIPQAAKELSTAREPPASKVANGCVAWRCPRGASACYKVMHDLHAPIETAAGSGPLWPLLAGWRVPVYALCVCIDTRIARTKRGQREEGAGARREHSAK